MWALMGVTLPEKWKQITKIPEELAFLGV